MTGPLEMNRNKNQDSLSPMLLPSVARLFATMCIFLFHSFEFINVYNRWLDFVGILIFCFLSGYLSSIKSKDPHRWMLDKYFQIMIPYWMVVIPLIVTNRIIGYKKATFISDLVALIGGNMFSENSIFVIGWYITFVLLLYLYIYLSSFTKKKYIPMVIGLIVGLLIGKIWYFLIFIAGIKKSYCNGMETISFLGKEIHAKISNYLLSIQKYCYSFFLIHGVSLQFIYYNYNFNKYQFIVISFVVSCFMAMIIYHLSGVIRKYVVSFFDNVLVISTNKQLNI